MVVWSGMYSKGMLNKLQRLQNHCKRIINHTPSALISIEGLIKIEMCELGYKTVHNLLPANLNACLNTSAHGSSLTRKHRYNTRNKGDLLVPIYKKTNFLNISTQEYSKLNRELKQSKTVVELTRRLKLSVRQNSEL